MSFGLEPRFLIGIATLFYGVAFLFGLIGLLRSRRYSHGVMYAFILSGFVIQTLGLYQRGIEVRGIPLSNPFEWVQFITWSVVFLYSLIGPPFRLNLLGFFTAGIAILFSLGTLCFTSWDYPTDPAPFRGLLWVHLHVLLALFSYSLFAVLALLSMMYWIQNFGLLHKRSQRLFSFFPSLQLLSRTSGRILFIGVGSLTLAVALGWANFFLLSAGEGLLFKILATSLLWLGYVVVWVLHCTHKLLARPFAWVCILLFVFAICTLIPVAGNQTRYDPGVSVSRETEPDER